MYFKFLFFLLLLFEINAQNYPELYTLDRNGHYRSILNVDNQGITDRYKGGIFVNQGGYPIPVHKTTQPGYFNQNARRNLDARGIPLDQMPPQRDPFLPDLMTIKKDGTWSYILTTDPNRVTREYRGGVFLGLRGIAGAMFGVLKPVDPTYFNRGIRIPIPRNFPPIPQAPINPIPQRPPQMPPRPNLVPLNEQQVANLPPPPPGMDYNVFGYLIQAGNVPFAAPVAGQRRRREESQSPDRRVRPRMLEPQLPPLPQPLVPDIPPPNRQQRRDGSQRRSRSRGRQRRRRLRSRSRSSSL